MSVVYSKQSMKHFDTLDPRLQRVLLYIKDVLEIDHKIICGFRGEEDQMAAYNSGKSQVKWPDGKHNQYPSVAVDVVPYTRLGSGRKGIHWNDEDKNVRELYSREMVRFATIVQIVARLIFNLELRWGGDWDKDWSLMDNRFNDYLHLEIVE